MGIRLIVARDRHFVWMAHGRAAVRWLPWALRLPPGGVEGPDILAMLRALTADLRRAGWRASWLVVAGGEVVGLISFRAPPDAEGNVEFGYGIAESRRNRGFGTAAVAALVRRAARIASIRRLIARTAADNHASQRVLTRCGFARTGTRIDPDEGLVVVWQKSLR